MNAPRILQLSAFLVAPVLVGPSVSELQLSLSEGASLRYTLVQNMTLDIDEMEMTFVMNGEEHPTQDMSEMELTITENEEVVFVDQYLKIGESSPVQLTRTYETLDSQGTQDGTDPMGEPISEEETKETELEGKTVAFSWDAEAEEWSCSFAEDSEGDEEMLEGLEPEVFFTALLPEGEVEAGDTWEIEPRLFMEATNPGGDIPWDEEDEDEGEDTEDQMLDNLEGTVTAELVGFAEEDGAELATIRFTAVLSSEFDEEPSEEEEAAADDSGMEFDVTATMSFEIELEGELVWDVKAGHARSLTLGGPISLDQDSSRSASGEVDIEMNMHQRLVGNLEIEVTVE